MSVRVWFDSDKDRAGFYCSTTETAFGPVFFGAYAVDLAEAFICWLGVDLRSVAGDRLAVFKAAFEEEFRVAGDKDEWLAHFISPELEAA